MVHLHERDLLKRRRADWEKLQRLADSAAKNGPHRLSDSELTEIGSLYRKALSDLALAQRHFPRSAVVGYLNQLVASTHAQIYGGSRMSWRGISRFVVHSFPMSVRENWRVIMGLAVLFFFAAWVGAWGWSTDHAAVKSLLPAEYAPHLHDLREDEFSLFLDEMKPLITSFIMTNNIQVSLLAFAFGVTFGLGTLWVIWHNGLILGPLAAAYHKAGYGLQFWSLILPHGVLELPAIFFSAAAGWLIGHAFLVPGQYRRIDAAKQASRKALPLLGGTVVLLIVAAFIEGFFTPSAVSPYVKLLFAVIVLAALLAYLMLLPRRNARANED